MRHDKFILNESGQPKAEPDLERWCEWIETGDRQIAKSQIGDSKVSTVFLGIDHNFEPKGPPVIWETMVFGGKLDQEMSRCAGTREQAEAMHQRMVERVRVEGERK